MAQTNCKSLTLSIRKKRQEKNYRFVFMCMVALGVVATNMATTIFAETLQNRNILLLTSTIHIPGCLALG